MVQFAHHHIVTSSDSKMALADEETYPKLLAEDEHHRHRHDQQAGQVKSWAVRIGNNNKSDEASSGSSRNNKGRCVAIRWATLLVVGVACLSLVAYHVWLTWHLQHKVAALEARLDADVDQVRSELRAILELQRQQQQSDVGVVDDEDDVVDDTSPPATESASLRGHPTSADEDFQVRKVSPLITPIIYRFLKYNIFDCFLNRFYIYSILLS